VITEFYAHSQTLADELKVSVTASLSTLNHNNAIFEQKGDELCLHLMLDEKPSQLKFDLAEGEVAIRANKVSKSNETIARAIGCKPHFRPRVLDEPAGMGRDSLMMAMLGCDVVMQERNFAIYSLLKNALERLQNSSSVNQPQAKNIKLLSADSLIAQPDLDNVDVIYLDPMFPERKKSALVKKEMRLFKRLVGADPDANQLLQQALESKVSRVVVKRPKGATLLAELKPSHEIKAKKFRYDVYLNLS